jgi:hypothetical protein
MCDRPRSPMPTGVETLSAVCCVPSLWLLTWYSPRILQLSIPGSIAYAGAPHHAVTSGNDARKPE